ncbi:hypothetical protein [Streptomyces sp. NPDC048340]|uniref:hypothetical protein n=1 Tax=Streptomyces sp. NPDC048340 TaxID=3365537 RepID=UPI003716C3D7
MDITRVRALEAAAIAVARFDEFGGEELLTEERQAVAVARRSGITIDEIVLRAQQLRAPGWTV